MWLDRFAAPAGLALRLVFATVKNRYIGRFIAPAEAGISVGFLLLH